MCIVSTSNLFEIAALHCCFQRRLILCGQAMRCCRSFRMVELCPTKTKAYSVWCILDDSLAQCSWSHENIKVCWATFENLEIGIIDLVSFPFLVPFTLRLALAASQKQRWRMKPMEPMERPVMCPCRRVGANQATWPTKMSRWRELLGSL